MSPEPFYQTERVAIYHGDALALLPAFAPESIDALVTDPPYSSGGLMRSDRAADPLAKYVQGGTRRADHSFSGDNRDQRSWCRWMSLWLGAAARLLRRGGLVYCFTDWRQLPTTTDAIQAAGLVWRGLIPWDKGRGARAPHTGLHRHQCEYVVFATRGACRKANGRGPGEGYVQAPFPSHKLHPTQKPVGAILPLLRLLPPGSTILDPFLGSGTTAAAALQAGHRCVGIDLEEHWCRVAADRLRTLAPSGEDLGPSGREFGALSPTSSPLTTPTESDR